MNEAMETLADVRRALTSGASSAEELTREALTRIERRNKELHAFVALDAERALADARAVDRLRKLGAALGPLAGAPIGVKDVIDVAGIATLAGSLTRKDIAPAERDASAVARLRAAGAVIIGKVHTVEYAFGGWGTNVTMGAPRNPRDMARVRVSGGSSSGSGVAVAAGLCVAALGTDTGGSVRLPASYCGTVGLKTTIGLVDKDGVVPLTPMLDTIGPLTNSIADATALLAVLAPAQDERFPGWTQRLAALAEGRGPGVAGRRIAVVANLGRELHPDTSRVLRRTWDRLEALGARVTEVSLSQALCDLSAPCGDLLAVEAYRQYGHFAEAEPSLLGAPVRKRMLSGREISGSRVMEVLANRQERMVEMALLFDKFDAILTPTTPTPAPVLGEHDEDLAPGLFTRFVNYCDLAALSLPMGATSEGLPVGMQIVVRGYGEPLALEIGAALEADRGPLRLGPAAD